MGGLGVLARAASASPFPGWRELLGPLGMSWFGLSEHPEAGGGDGSGQTLVLKRACGV